jgi:hypothetical protein
MSTLPRELQSMLNKIDTILLRSCILFSWFQEVEMGTEIQINNIVSEILVSMTVGQGLYMHINCSVRVHVFG